MYLFYLMLDCIENSVRIEQFITKELIKLNEYLSIDIFS